MVIGTIWLLIGFKKFTLQLHIHASWLIFKLNHSVSCNEQCYTCKISPCGATMGCVISPCGATMGCVISPCGATMGCVISPCGATMGCVISPCGTTMGCVVYLWTLQVHLALQATPLPLHPLQQGGHLSPETSALLHSCLLSYLRCLDNIH